MPSFFLLLTLFAAEPTTPLARGVHAIAKLQGEDGAWHSEYYGNLKQGAAVTSLVIDTISRTPANIRKEHTAALREAYGFLRQGLKEKGQIVNPDGSPDFPTYGAALTLSAVSKMKIGASEKETQKLVEFLITAQLGKRREFDADSPHFGGWDLMGLTPLLGKTSGTNVSITRHAMEALANIKTDAARQSLARGLKWTTHVQNLKGDGGFYFTPGQHEVANKAGGDDDSVRSYGSTTCDGLLCLAAAGVKPTDPRFEKAVAWIIKHDSTELVPGFKKDDQTGWREGLRYYYYAGLARCLKHLPPDRAADIAQRLKKQLTKSQQKNGLWSNESSRMREDDPLIASCFAIIALTEIEKLD